jgi:predicted transcriptional regulator/ribosomal protein S18 acetylase RimI-like enzyme
MKPETEKFDFRQELTVVRFGTSDIDPDPEQLRNFKNIIEECNDNYPGIDLWFEKKVKPGLREKKRGGILIYHNDKPVGASIVRRGADGKLCSLRIKPDYQKYGLGRLLMALSVLEFKSSESIHFTIPASLWESKTGFFENYGFHFIERFKTQYRHDDDELLCAGFLSDALNRVIMDLPELFDTFSVNKDSKAADLILSVRPNFLSKIVSGEKKVELRKKFSKKWEGATVILYATHPYHEFVGEAKINRVVMGKPIDIWYEYRDFLGCDRDAFFSYCEGKEDIYALLLSNVRRFEMPVGIDWVNKIFNTVISKQKEITPPQSHCRVQNELLYPIAVLRSSLFNFKMGPG